MGFNVGHPGRLRPNRYGQPQACHGVLGTRVFMEVQSFGSTRHRQRRSLDVGVFLTSGSAPLHELLLHILLLMTNRLHALSIYELATHNDLLATVL
jgi:hypothetical protein